MNGAPHVSLRNRHFLTRVDFFNQLDKLTRQQHRILFYFHFFSLNERLISKFNHIIKKKSTCYALNALKLNKHVIIYLLNIVSAHIHIYLTKCISVAYRCDADRGDHNITIKKSSHSKDLRVYGSHRHGS